MNKYNMLISCMMLSLPVLADSKNKNDAGTFSFYAPIHATNLSVDVPGMDDSIDAGVKDLFDAHTRYFTFGFKWQGEKWFHQIEVWEGKYEPVGDGLALDGSGKNGSTDMRDIDLSLPSGGTGIKGNLQAAYQLSGQGDLYVDMRQRITEYRTGYNFMQAGDLKLYVVGGIREYDQTVDVSISNLSLSGSINLEGELERCGPFGSCSGINPDYDDGDLIKDGIVDGSINVDNIDFDITIPFTLNSRWVEATIGVQAEYNPFAGVTLSAMHMAGFIGGQSKQTDLKAQYAFNSGIFVEAGYRWHNFESDGLKITQNGGLLGFGYTF
ncbi:MAG: hypothetical protein HRU20_01145 [Pseudomonadales bacterium]|nr:hypothetical protein [Pseudomonadales bacterium]